MAVITRALHWFAGSRFRMAGALAALALVAVGLVVLQGGDDHGGEQVDASASNVRAGARSTTTTSTKDGRAAAGDSTTPTTAGLRRGGRVEITTHRGARAGSSTSGTATRPASDRHARKPPKPRSSTQPAPGPNRGSPPPSTTSTTAPAPSNTTTTTTPTTSTTAPPPVANGRIVFVDATDVGGDITRIAVMDADGGNVTPLTDGLHADTHPAWSPDGAQIAFDRFENNARRVFVMAADGTGVHQVSGADGSATSPTWSPDGTRLAVVAGTDIAVVDLASGQTTVVGTDVAAANEAGLAWSPDGSLLAWAGTTGIRVSAPDGSGARQLTTGDDHDPAWSPDGSRLLVRRADTVVTVDRSGAASAPIAAGDGFANLEWSPDGQRFLYDCAGTASTAASLCERAIDGSGRVVLDATATDGDWLATAQP